MRSHGNISSPLIAACLLLYYVMCNRIKLRKNEIRKRPGKRNIDMVHEDDVIGLRTLNSVLRTLNPTGYLPTVNQFFGFLPLKSGIIVLTFYYLVTVIMSVMVNLMWLCSISTFSCLLIYIFNACILMTWSITIFGVVKNTFWQVKNALILWTVLVGMWTFVVVYSLSESGKIILCLESRCPESFWVNTNSWHDVGLSVIVFRPVHHEEPIRNAPTVKGNQRLQNPDFKLKFKPSHSAVVIGLAEQHANKKKLANTNPIVNEPASGKKYPTFSETPKQITTLFFTITINVGMLLYSWLILYSYYRKGKDQQPK